MQMTKRMKYLDLGSPFEVAGELQVRSPQPDLVECLARADANRGVIKARENDIKIQDRQYTLDQSELLMVDPNELREAASKFKGFLGIDEAALLRLKKPPRFWMRLET